MKNKSNSFLEEAPLGSLMRKYAIPCIISLLVAALYNIVDQIFIANATYLGSYGNAANTVIFPLTVVALAIAVMIVRNICLFQRVLFLDYTRHTFLYVRSGDEPDYPCRRQP